MTASRSDEERSTAPSGPARMTTALRTWGSWCGRIVFERIGTARAIAAAAGAWAAIAAAGLPIVIAGLCCALLGAVLVLVHRPATARRSSHRRRASRMIGPVVGGLLAALGLSVLVAGRTRSCSRTLRGPGGRARHRRDGPTGDPVGSLPQRGDRGDGQGDGRLRAAAPTGGVRSPRGAGLVGRRLGGARECRGARGPRCPVADPRRSARGTRRGLRSRHACGR